MTPIGNAELKLYELIEKNVNVDSIKDLLRVAKAKQPKEVLLSESKPHLIETLEKCVTNGWLEPIAPYMLLRDAEENGRVRIAYFKPKTKQLVAMLNDQNEVGRAILGANWQQKYAIPKLTCEVGNPTVVDFHSLSPQKADWLIKLYSYDVTRKLVGSTKDTSPLLYTETWKVQTDRVVSAVRWNARGSSGWLEFRVSTGPSPVAYEGYIKGLWSLLENGLCRKTDFDQVDLSKSMKEIILNQEVNKSDYQVCDVKAWDKADHGYVVNPHDNTTHSLKNTECGVDLFRRILDRGGKIGNLVLDWLPKQDGSVPYETKLTCVIGGGTKGTLNRLTIQAEATSAAIDYVTDQLRHFGA